MRHTNSSLRNRRSGAVDSEGEGRLGGDGAGREGGSGPDRSQPPRRAIEYFAELEAACEAVHGRGQHASAPLTRRAAAGRCWPRSTSSCIGCRRVPHTMCFGADPQGQLAVADLGGRRAVLGPARADRRARVGSDRRRAARRRARRWALRAPRGRAPSADHAGSAERSRTSTTRPGRRARLSASPAPARMRSERSSRLGDGAEAWLIGAARRRRAAGAAQDGRGGRPRQAPRRRRGRPRARSVRGRRPVRRR